VSTIFEFLLNYVGKCADESEGDWKLLVPRVVVPAIFVRRIAPLHVSCHPPAPAWRQSKSGDGVDIAGSKSPAEATLTAGPGKANRSSCLGSTLESSECVLPPALPSYRSKCVCRPL
jgi:hypothetical protein